MADTYIKSDYLHAAFEPARLDRIVRRMRKALPAYNPDTIVCRGVSGMSVAFTLSIRSGIRVTIVRKPNESTHSAYSVEGVMGARTYVIVDDFICGGHTIRHIRDELDRAYINKAKCVAVFTYRGDPHGNTRDKISDVFGKATDWRDFDGA